MPLNDIHLEKALETPNLQNYTKRLITLCTWWYQDLCKKWKKKTADFHTNNKNIHPEYKNGIWHRKMCHAYNKKWQKRNNCRNRTAKSGKHQNAWREGKILVLGNIRGRHYQTEMKEKIRKEYFKRTRKFLETKLCCRNLIKGINNWAVLLIRYSEPFLKWTREELEQIDQRTRKLMIMHKVLHPGDDIYRLCHKKRRKKRTHYQWGLYRYTDKTTWRLHFKKAKKD